MKFIVERWGTSSTKMWQQVEIDADSLEDAQAIAKEHEGCNALRVLDGDDLADWDSCEDRDTSDVVEAEEYFRRQQCSMAARLAPVFDDYNGR